ncbi:MAG: type II CRISPR RNA-guided endonuclease Cas9 [Muribaculaceae bacterium]|nr:type II CRISPR RNA-guided endonuclease Cas9 [Muribaculaceae bacterium]
MKRILGLDLGTTSIGWAVVNQAENDTEVSSIEKLGVRLSNLTTDEQSNFEKGKSITTAADRTLKRSMRRNLSRYKQRRERLLYLLKTHHIIDDSTPLCEDGPNTTFETLRLRAKAVTEEITLAELARVLVSINKKRGYKSNRKAKNEDESGQLIDGMEVARYIYDNNLTPGQYVYSLLTKEKKYVPPFYASDLRNEFNLIWQKQSVFYPDVLTDELKESLRNQGKKNTISAFKKLGVDAAEEKKRDLRQRAYYSWRNAAITRQIPIEQVATCLAEINNAITSSSGLLGSISDHSKELIINNMTVGQFMMLKLNANPHFSFKNYVFYRLDYLNEFNAIWDNQAQYHPELTEELKREICDLTIFHQRRLKSQKGLIQFCELEGKEIEVKQPNGKIKKVMTGPRACPKSSPLFQEFKIWQQLNNIEIKDKTIKGKESSVALSAEQKSILYRELTWNKELSVKDVLKCLELNERQYSINYKKLSGNTTQCALLDAYKRIAEISGHDVENFEKQSTDYKLHLATTVLEMLGANTAFLHFNEGENSDELQQNAMFKLWHLLYSSEDDGSPTGNDKLTGHLMDLTGLPREYAIELASVVFPLDYGNLSSKAMMKILPYMKKDGLTYDKACEKAGYRHSKQSLTKEEIEKRKLDDKLELLNKGSLRNPVVEKILNQMIHVVNACLEQYGKFDEIHIEMARSLKQTREQREKATTRLNEKTRQLEAIRKILHEPPFNLPNPTRNDVLRYQLYEELAFNGFKTLYSNTYIQKEELFSRNFDIEHIIPQAKLFDDSYSNKTLELRNINIEKGNMTARDYVLQKYGEERLQEYLNRVKYFDKPGSKQKFKYLTMPEKDIPNDFLNRDLSDSQYIARKAKEILERVCKDVLPTIGSITARMREDWGLVDVMKELNWDKYDALGLTECNQNRDGHVVKHIKDWTKRNDHRHHAMDALTIAFTRRQHIQYLNHLNALGADAPMSESARGIQRNELLENRKFKLPMPNFRAEAMKHLQDILISIKAKNRVATPNVNKPKGCKGSQRTLTPRVQLHNETVYGKKQQYATALEKVNKDFNKDKIATVCRADYREALLKRLQEFGGDAAKAFTGKNSLDKNPIWLDERHTVAVPNKVKTVVFEPVFTIRKPISPELSVDKVIDEGIKDILKKRLKDYGGSAKLAFSDLDKNPIWLNEEKGIAIKRVTLKGVNVATPLHEKRDKNGNIIEAGNKREPNDYVSTSNNHHVAIFEDADGNWQEHIVSYFEAMAILVSDVGPVIDKNYNKDKGWKFLFTMKRNEYFVFPDAETGFDPNEIDLTNPLNYPEISKHLFRVQKLATKYYVFRHHLETNVDDVKELRETTWKRITAINNLKGIVKVRLDHLGRIVHVGEY